MTMRKLTALTVSGGLAVLGIGWLLLPTWAQPPKGGDRPQAERFGNGQQDPFASVERMQQDIKRMQRDLERARIDLEKRMQELQQRTQDFNRLMDQAKRQSSDAAPKAAEPKRAGRGQLAQGEKIRPPGADDPTASPGSGLPMTPGFGGAGGGRATSPSDVERRLQQLERKLDMLIQLMRQNERPARPGRVGGTPGPGIAPSAPEAGERTVPTAPSVPAAGVRPATSERSPLPATVPGNRRSQVSSPETPSAPVGF